MLRLNAHLSMQAGKKSYSNQTYIFAATKRFKFAYFQTANSLLLTLGATASGFPLCILGLKSQCYQGFKGTVQRDLRGVKSGINQ